MVASKMESSQKEKNLLLYFLYGSMGLLLLMLTIVYATLVAQYQSIEAQRTNTFNTQVLKGFQAKYIDLSEESSLYLYEAVSLRSLSLFAELGVVDVNISIFDLNNNCVYNEKGEDFCHQKSLEKNRPIESALLSGTGLEEFEKTLEVALYLGQEYQGTIMASFKDPYRFDSKRWSVGPSFTIFGILVLSIFLWGFWFYFSRRHLLGPYFQKIGELDKQNELYQVTKQVAHDIRSPLAVLKTLSEITKFPDVEAQKLFDGSLQRISGIANDVMNKYDRSSRKNKYKASELLSSIVEEKKIEIYGKNISIDLLIDENSRNIFVELPKSDFLRSFSNLLNNAVEAIAEDRSGQIYIVSYVSDNDKLKITIRDNGVGIPEDLLPKIRLGSGSYNKTNGHGLGIRHAIHFYESIQGSFSIKSKEGEYTQVDIELPIASRPQNYITLLPENSVFIGNFDEEVLSKLGSKAINDVNTFYPMKNEYSLKNTYVFSSDLGDHPLDAEELIESYNITDQSIILLDEPFDSSISRHLMNKNYRIMHQSNLSLSKN